MSNYTKKELDTKVQDYLKLIFGFLVRTLVLVLVIRYAVVTPGRVHGVSMEPTYQSGAYFVVNKLPYYFSAPSRYDIVQALDPTDGQKLLIKRVIGLPGEKIIFVNNKVFVQQPDGTTIEVDESYLAPGTITRQALRKPESIILPADSYYLLGDNRLASRDSREIGPIHRKYINGKIVRITKQKPLAANTQDSLSRGSAQSASATPAIP